MALNVVYGNDLLLFAQSGSESFAPVGSATSHTATFDREMRDISSKRDGDTMAQKPGKKSVSVSTDGLVVYSEAWNYKKLSDLWDSGTAVNIFLGSGSYVGGAETGSTYYMSGSFYISNLTINSGHGENANYSAEFTLAESGYGFFNG